MIGGNMVEEAVIDKKGRIVIPAHLRQGLGLREGAKVKLALEEGKILIMRPVTPEEFIHEMEGCIKEDFPIPKINPLELKKIWEKQ
jgi:AbrB family looped-hinge helix DNA binding protein